MRSKHVEHLPLIAMAEMKKLSQARIPWNDRLSDSERISPTIQSCAGRRVRQNEIKVGRNLHP